MAFIVDSGVQARCPHGGMVQFTPGSTKVSLTGKAALRMADTATIVGCAFNVSGAPSPCMRVTWMMPATKVLVEGSPVLLSSSIGLCVNAAGAPQGLASLSGYQTKVEAQ